MQHKLSTETHTPSEYDKLLMSLLSPLPNEQDFAINVCTLMSNECKQTLRIGKCPRLIIVLLAHAGIFDHCKCVVLIVKTNFSMMLFILDSMREMFTEFYTTVRQHSQQHFWRDSLVEKPDVLELLYEDCLSDEQVFLDEEKAKTLFARDGADNKSDLEDLHFLSLGRGLGTHDYIGQRVLQVAQIIRNLSFNEENVALLAKNRSLIRYLLMCSNVLWSNIHHIGLDILGNLAMDLELSDPFVDNVSRQLFGTVSDGLESKDRGVVISCLEILSKLSQKQSNEEFLFKFLRKSVSIIDIQRIRALLN